MDRVTDHHRALARTANGYGENGFGVKRIEATAARNELVKTLGPIRASVLMRQVSNEEVKKEKNGGK